MERQLRPADVVSSRSAHGRWSEWEISTSGPDDDDFVLVEIEPPFVVRERSVATRRPRHWPAAARARRYALTLAWAGAGAVAALVALGETSPSRAPDSHTVDELRPAFAIPANSMTVDAAILEFVANHVTTNLSDNAHAGPRRAEVVGPNPTDLATWKVLFGEDLRLTRSPYRLSDRPVRLS